MNNMKKSDALMFAYVCFLLLSVALRAATDYPAWHSLVMAVTFSSMLFSCANLLRQDAKEALLVYSFQKPLLSPLIKQFLDLQLSEYLNNADIQSTVFPNEKSQAQTLASKSANDQLGCKLAWENAKNNKLKLDSEKEHKWSNFFTFLGFLFLLLILISPSVYLPTDYLEQITVFAFAVVMVQDLFDEQLSQRLKTRSEKVAQLADECEMVIQQEKLRREKSSDAN